MPAETPSRKLLAEVTEILHAEIDTCAAKARDYVSDGGPETTEAARADLQQSVRDYCRDKVTTLRAFVRWLDTVPRGVDEDDGGPVCADCGDTLTAYPFRAELLCNTCDHPELCRLERVAEHPAFCWTCGHVHPVVAMGFGKILGVCDECTCTRCLTSVEKIKSDLASLGAQRTDLGGGLAMYEIPAPPKGEP